MKIKNLAVSETQSIATPYMRMPVDSQRGWELWAHHRTWLRVKLINSDIKVMVMHRLLENVGSSVWHALSFQIYWKHINCVCSDIYRNIFINHFLNKPKGLHSPSLTVLSMSENTNTGSRFKVFSYIKI